MDKDQISGKFDQAVGRAKQGIGEAVGSDRLANEGVADQVKGAGKETWGNVKDTARSVTGTTPAGTTDTGNATHARENVSDKVADMKDRVNEKIDDFKDRNRRTA
jgi:uncharacterized protein YjbJ (UPF0337 family)